MLASTSPFIFIALDKLLSFLEGLVFWFLLSSVGAILSLRCHRAGPAGAEGDPLMIRVVENTAPDFLGGAAQSARKKEPGAEPVSESVLGLPFLIIIPRGRSCDHSLES